MSFLSRATPLLRTTATTAPARCFSTAVIYRKTATEAVTEPVKKVDRVVSDQLVKGIDAAVAAKDQAAATVGVQADKTKGKTAEVSGEAKGKAAELTGKAKGQVAEVQGKMS